MRQQEAGTMSVADSALLPLAALGPKQVGLIRAVTAEPDDAARLKALGLCIGRRVQLVKAGDPLILRLFHSHLGLSVLLARQIQVQPCGGCWME